MDCQFGSINIKRMLEKKKLKRHRNFTFLTAYLALGKKVDKCQI